MGDLTIRVVPSRHGVFTATTCAREADGAHRDPRVPVDAAAARQPTATGEPMDSICGKTIHGARITSFDARIN
jgi:hypothetical protein